MTTAEVSTDNIFGEAVYSYSREQAINDGILVDVSETAREAGIKFPVAITSALWGVIENIPASQSFQDVKGRLWDLLWMGSLAMRRGGQVIHYKLIMHNGRHKYLVVKAVCGPGDNIEPVITISLPNED
jgi:hypothetical protein